MRYLWVALVLMIFPSFCGAGCSFDQLPSPIQRFVSDEQTWEYFDVPAWAIKKGTLSKWDSPYAPNSHQAFEIQGCWVSPDDFNSQSMRAKVFPKIFEDQIARRKQSIQNVLKQNPGQKEKILFFIHPAAHKSYDDAGFFAKLAEQECEKFCATPTTSNRSLVVWSEAKKDFIPIIVKTSLNVHLGGGIKSVSPEEAEVSVTTNSLLESDKSHKKVTPHYRFFEEPLSFSLEFQPTDTAKDRNFVQGAGFVLRKFPLEITSGHSHIVSGIALYGDSADPNNKSDPYLLKFYKGKSVQALNQELQLKLIDPFVEEWLAGIFEFGVVPEPHSQNLLVELGKDSLAGRFWHRDLDGFHVDNEYRNKLGLPVGSHHQGQIQSQILVRSIYNFFNGGFLAPIQSKLAQWKAAGHLTGEIPSETLETFLFTKILNQLLETSGFSFDEKERQRLLADFHQGNRKFILVRFNMLANAILQIQKMKALDSIAERHCADNFHYNSSEDTDFHYLYDLGFRFSLKSTFTCQTRLEEPNGSYAVLKLMSTLSSNSCLQKINEGRARQMKDAIDKAGKRF